VTSLESASNLFSGLPMRLAAYLALAPQNGFRQYLKAMQQTDQTFKGLYHWNPLESI
jgi:hypothetical protein